LLQLEEDLLLKDGQIAILRSRWEGVEWMKERKKKSICTSTYNNWHNHGVTQWNGLQIV
jgi:hypothetical protein